MDPDLQRSEMVTRLKEAGIISDSRVIEAMSKVPRHLFVPEDRRILGYIDRPLEIGEGQTISAPHMVGIMAQALDLHPGMKVLEVGGGSGYHAAVMGELVRPGGKIYSVERIASLAETARKNLIAAGYDDVVEMIIGDGSEGLKEHAPYDRISVAAASPTLPRPLMDQLVDGGLLLIPVGDRSYQELVMVKRVGRKFERFDLGSVVFVPLIGKYGHTDL